MEISNTIKQQFESNRQRTESEKENYSKKNGQITDPLKVESVAIESCNCDACLYAKGETMQYKDGRTVKKENRLRENIWYRTQCQVCGHIQYTQGKPECCAMNGFRTGRMIDNKKKNYANADKSKIGNDKVPETLYRCGSRHVRTIPKYNIKSRSLSKKE